MPDESTPTRSFSALYEATIRPLRRYLGRMLADRSEAQDIAHDAYLRLYPHVIERPPVNPEALLFTTARRLALNRLKRRQIAPFAPGGTDPADHAAPGPGVSERLMERQDLEQLEHAIADLPAGCRSVLLLRKVELLSHREIADRLGITVSTVEKQHARALRLLRAALRADAPATRPVNPDTIRP